MPAEPSPARSSASLPFARLSSWLVTPRGQWALAVGLFALAEMFSLPILVIALVVVPFSGGPPVLSHSPTMFWSLLAATLAIPAVCSLVFYLRVRQGLGKR